MLPSLADIEAVAGHAEWRAVSVLASVAAHFAFAVIALVWPEAFAVVKHHETIALARHSHQAPRLGLLSFKDGAHQGRLEHQAGFFHVCSRNEEPRSVAGLSFLMTMSALLQNGQGSSLVVLLI